MTDAEPPPDRTNNMFTDGSTADILAAIPTLSVPTATSYDLRQKRVVVVGGSIGGLAVAACLRAAGFVNVRVIEKSEGSGAGTGIGVDDASVGILKGLGMDLVGCARRRDGEEEERSSRKASSACDVIVQRMRWAEERVVQPSNGGNRITEEYKVLDRQPYPYSAVRYAELAQGLETVATVAHPMYAMKREGILRGIKAINIEEIEEDGYTFVRVHLESTTNNETSTMDCDLAVVADGPRSQFRSTISDCDKEKEDLRFAGYTAWRGTIPESDLPCHVQVALRNAYPHFSNCLYFLCGPPGKSAVLYDIGNGLVNWLVYECCDRPKAPPGRTTTTATPDDIATLKENSIAEWGNALGAVIRSTPQPFQNDIYDIRTPLTSFTNASGNICIVGDAAHPITPHAAKGSNLALQDAFLLACAAEQADGVSELLHSYSESRVLDCRNKVLMSRHLGRLRNGMPLLAPDGTRGKENDLPPPPRRSPYAETFLLDVVGWSANVPTFTLPSGSEAFTPTWKFVEEQVPTDQRGFWLAEREMKRVDGSNDEEADDSTNDTTAISPTLPPPSLALVEVNHISLETDRVDRLVSFYQNVLGLPFLPRPNFGFGGAWLQLPGGKWALHIIESDPEKPGKSPDDADTTSSQSHAMIPERYIRRSRHVALTVLDIETAKSTLRAHGIIFAINRVPGTAVEQLFFYDPDGNGIEIGNFNA